MTVAAVARYSSDNLREASVEDQLRDVQALCLRNDWRPLDVTGDHLRLPDIGISLVR